MSEYAPLFSTRINKADQQCLQHAAARQVRPVSGGKWARDVLREAAVSEIAILTMRRIDAVCPDAGLATVIRLLNDLSAAHTFQVNQSTLDPKPPTLSDKEEFCPTKPRRSC